MCKWLFIVFLSCICFLQINGQSLSSVLETAKAAYEAGDREAYLESMVKANELKPNETIIVYDLARAFALNNRKARAIQTLNQLLLIDATIAFDQDPDFSSLKRKGAYNKLLALQTELTRQEVYDEVFVQIQAAELHPESFVILPDGGLLLGSIREKRIVRLMPDGSYVNWLETPYGVMGMKIDELTNTLWVATAAVPEMMGYSQLDRGKSTVLQVDLNTGFILQGLAYDEGSTIRDIEPDGHQRLWLSNSYDPILTRDDTDTTYMLGAFTRLTFDLSLNYFKLKGLALASSEKYLYFSDYVKGLFRIDIELQEVQPVMSSKDVVLKGIDGLYAYKNTLIAIHNGTKPFKVVQYFLNEEGTFIDVARVINRGGESLGTPTLGQVRDGYFYYLANAPREAYENGELQLEDLPLIEIRRIRLD